MLLSDSRSFYILTFWIILYNGPYLNSNTFNIVCLRPTPIDPFDIEILPWKYFNCPYISYGITDEFKFTKTLLDGGPIGELPENWDQTKDDTQSLFLNKSDKNDLEPYPLALSEEGNEPNYLTPYAFCLHYSGFGIKGIVIHR